MTVPPVAKTSNTQKMLNIPITQVGALIDTYGLQTAWLHMLATLAKQSFTHAAAARMLLAPDYENARQLAENPLDGLSIGQIGLLYEFSLARVSTASRKQEGQYFTPDDVAMFLADRAAAFPTGVWLDPCAGIGNLSYWLAAAQPSPEQFISERLFCMDLDATALFIGRSLFTLLFYAEDADLFTHLAVRFVNGNFLTAALPAHDNVIVNPPYVQVPADPTFEAAAARDLYAYFLERVLKTSTGFVSITPLSFTHGRKFTTLRTMLMEHFSSINIYVFDNVPDSIFRGIKFGSTNTNQTNSTRAAIMVAHNQGQARRITPLLRWITAKRAELLARSDEFLAAAPFTTQLFPKVSANLVDFYTEVAGWQTLEHWLSAKPTAFSLAVPSTPRYFIPAVKRSLVRSSTRMLYFKSAADRDLLYPLLNSSLLYWWWRVNDGGMTLSDSTLRSLPVPPTLLPQPDLMALLTQSEQENVVIKVNAGKPNENVKHGIDLMHRLNATFFTPKVTVALEATHANSMV